MAPIHIGSLVFDYQAIDVIGPCDLLNSCSKRLITALSFFGPVNAEALARAPEFVFHHIGETRDPVRLLTSALTLTPTTTVDDCPELDCLLVGGPNPVNHQIPPKYVEFIQRHVAKGKLLFTICTGAAVVAATGVLDGRNATVNNVEYDWVSKRFPDVKWTKEKKWVVEGNIWTGSGAVAGMDMIAHWIKENYGLEVLRQGTLSLDYEPRDIDGLFNVLPQRYDEAGRKISTHVFP
ncbi:class I glutamine amidotransferase-like protein [Aspergillus cavernicola]|uniref:Class I glutamine amidotransferase-like protein n=1 Tax=Aspergillus cavernicola TaxID=176166 RepID=A0ABR4IDD6_9EURO